MTMKVRITGIRCKACKILIEEVGGTVRGVSSVLVNFETGETLIEYNESFDLSVFANEIAGLGNYGVAPEGVVQPGFFVR